MKSPFVVEKIQGGGYVVIDARGRRIATVHSNLEDEAARVADNIAKSPQMFGAK